MQFNKAHNQIKKVKEFYKTRDVDKIRDTLKAKKSSLVDNNDQEGSKEIWCYETILQIQEDYLLAYELLEDGKFYQAWCKFERIEINAGFLHRHFNLETDKYSLSFICSATDRFQSLYPYQVFFSTEFLEKEKVCTICGNVVSLRNHCGHKVGEIYDGEMASRKVTDIDILGISLVENPTHKYSVPFRSDEEGNKIDHYDYSILPKLIQNLEGPFHKWEVKTGSLKIT